MNCLLVIYLHPVCTNAPEQKSSGDVWLQAKRFAREFYHLCHSLVLVKVLFGWYQYRQTFDFRKLVYLHNLNLGFHIWSCHLTICIAFKCVTLHLRYAYKMNGD